MNLKNKIFIVFIIILFFITPISSFADDILDEDVNSYNVLEAASSSVSKDIPLINARHAIVLDRASGTVLYGKNENEKCKMASTTKILTGIVVIENCSNLSSIVSVSSKAAHTGRFQTWIVYG